MTVEIPTVETLTVEVLTVETPTVEILTAEILTAEIPTVEIPTVEIPTVEIPTVETLTVEILTVEIPSFSNQSNSFLICTCRMRGSAVHTRSASLSLGLAVTQPYCLILTVPHPRCPSASLPLSFATQPCSASVLQH